MAARRIISTEITSVRISCPCNEDSGVRCPITVGRVDAPRESAIVKRDRLSV
jgi:hypothetical protein